MKLAIAIFVKTPGASPLKTRLAATIGQHKAEHFYRLSLRCIVDTLNKIDVNPYWAIAEKQSLENPIWNDFNKLHTGDGDLGDRQSHVYHELLKTHDGVLLIGGDAPQLSEGLIAQASTGLNTNDYIIGPATDGGYYLLGGKRPIAENVWANTPWSDAKTKETLVSLLDSKPLTLASLSDVDNEADLQQMLTEMPDELNASQSHLKQWINQL